MARLIGPADGERMVARLSPEGEFESATGLQAVAYSDRDATTLADILTEDGSTISGSRVTVGDSSLLPVIQYPDGVDTVYFVIAGGPVVGLRARGSLGGGGSGTVTSVNGVGPDSGGNIILAAADVDADPAGAAAAITLSGLGGVSTARQVTAGAGLTGGGDLSADRSLAVAYGTAAGTAAQGDDSRITGAAQKAANLSDLADAPTARTNLGLGGAATLGVGTSTGTVAAGDDARITGAQQKSTLTTKGDLYVHLDDGTISRLAAGTNNQVLTADSTRSAGVKWADPTGGTKAPVTLTDGATIATDASLSSTFRVTLAGNRTLSNPTNAADGQVITWEITQDGTGSRTLSLDTKFKFGSDLTSITLSTTAGATDILAVKYNSTADKFRVVSFVRGY